MAPDVAVAAQLQHLGVSISRLHIARLKKCTQKVYVGILMKLMAKWKRQTLPRWAPHVWDAALVDEVWAMYRAGLHKSSAIRTMAAVLWGVPELGPNIRTVVPSTSAMTRGWSRLEPGRSRRVCGRPERQLRRRRRPQRSPSSPWRSAQGNFSRQAGATALRRDFWDAAQQMPLGAILLSHVIT